MHSFFTKTLYQKRHMALFWSIGIGLMSFITVSVYSSFQSVDFEELLKSLPPALQKLAGDSADLKTVDGYLRQQVFAQRIPLLTIILSIALLVGITAGDEQKGLHETHLSLPISRSKLLLQKLAAGIAIIGFASLGCLTGIAIGLLVQGETFDPLLVLQYTLNCLVLSLAFGMVAFAVAAITGSRGLAVGVGSAYAFLSYLINSMALSVKSLEPFDKLTLFHYYQNLPIELSNVIVLVGTIMILLLLSLFAFAKRDIKTK